MHAEKIWGALLVESSGCPFFCGGSDDSDEARIFVPCRAPEIQCSYGFVGDGTADSDLFEKDVVPSHAIPPIPHHTDDHRPPSQGH